MKPSIPALCLATLLALAGCNEAAKTGAAPVEIGADTTCSLDGMLLNDYPGPKAQIHYVGQARPDFFCDTVEMFSTYLQPEAKKQVAAIYVQDMGKADWDHPTGHWIDAKTATYVQGSKRTGSMGPTIAAFAKPEDAQAFAAKYGGKVLRFSDVKPGQVALDGGVIRDEKM